MQIEATGLVVLRRPGLSGGETYRERSKRDGVGGQEGASKGASPPPSRLGYRLDLTHRADRTWSAGAVPSLCRAAQLRFWASACVVASREGRSLVDPPSRQELLETLVGLAKVAESGDVEQLRAAVEQCGGGPLANTSEFYVCKECGLASVECRLAHPICATPAA